MSNRNYISVGISFLLYVLFQVLLLKNFVLFDTAFCFVYVAFIFLLPLETGPLLLIFLSFLMGLTIDIFYDKLGINAAVSVLIGFIRPYWLRLITPRGGYENVEIPTLRSFGFAWFARFVFPLIFVHHFILFFLEAGGFDLFWFTFWKVLLSSVYTFIFVVLTQYLFYKKSAQW